MIDPIINFKSSSVELTNKFKSISKGEYEFASKKFGYLTLDTDLRFLPLKFKENKIK